jgi:hypothetical protein
VDVILERGFEGWISGLLVERVEDIVEGGIMGASAMPPWFSGLSW